MYLKALLLCVGAAMAVGCSTKSSGGDGPGPAKGGQQQGLSKRSLGFCAYRSADVPADLCAEIFHDTADAATWKAQCEQQHGGNYADRCPLQNIIVTCETVEENVRVIYRAAANEDQRENLIKICKQKNGTVR